MRVLFAGGGTGGHLYPGLAIARAIVCLDPRVRPHFVGALRGVERDVLPQTEFPHDLLDLHPLYRQRPWENWKTVRGAVGAWRRIGRLAAAERPRLVVGTGGYASGLALAYARLRGVPYVLQEQNSHAGLTTRFFAPGSRAVYLGFPEAAAGLRKGSRTEFVDSGNPIEPPPRDASQPAARAAARERWGFPERDGRVLLVFGGSQGARALNEAMSAWVGRGLPEGLRVIWATGRGNFERFGHLEGERVRVRPYLSPIAEAYAASDLALARAGAMGTAELCAWGLPQILVPLPTAAADHQTKNADALAAAGAAIVVEQAELTAERLDSVVRGLLGDSAALGRMAERARARARPNAAEDIARHALKLIGA
ncbi:MAG TPA: UDP-N-acetylglucosamine--N-acetylmuramyl-(pentapeptide) pyrophosphoryl-undecaprenol N-acetylglucosamine transferase [Gemmatimonadaceae bacterium]|nr:UDP-N-acetylglucosamine--N-acetylmuramyl-(pentapeptide) pyrophosphoryl-undecaprenol N-acetylglucosamine transferase [Gemmatimonadaceae bacterium]